MFLLDVALLHSSSQRLTRAIIRVYDRSKVVRKFGLDVIHKTWVPFLKLKLSDRTEDLCCAAAEPCLPLPTHSVEALGHGQDEGSGESEERD